MKNRIHPTATSSPASTSVLNDQLVDMAFITTLCEMTDELIYRQIQHGHLPDRLNWVAVHDGLKARQKSG